MANDNRVLLKKSSVASKIPANTDIQIAEVAINLTDKVLYSKDTANTVFLLKADPLYNTGLQDNLDAKVDVAGDTMTGDLEVQGTVTVDHLQFNTTANNTVQEGESFWNSSARTVELGLGNDVIYQYGQELYHPLVKNNTANTITNGTTVGFIGVDNSWLTIAPYISDGSFGDAINYLGIATEDIAPGALGYITYFGEVHDVNTEDFTIGDVLYASANTAGVMTNVMPETPNDIVVIGIATHIDSTEGTIKVSNFPHHRAYQIPYDNIDSELIASNVQSAIDELQETKASVDLLSSSITLYPTTAIGDFGYNRMVTDIDDADYDDTAVNVSTGSITTTNQLISTLIADANQFIGNPGVINITTIGNIRKDSGTSNRYAEFYFTIYKRDAGGTETLITTSSTTGAINGTIGAYNQFSASALLNNGTFISTDRLVFRYYANLIGVSGPTYSFQFGGENPVRSLIPVPISVIPSRSAEETLLDTSDFNGILTGSEDNVQAAIDRIDDYAAPLASPALTGNPTAPTAASSTNTSQLATTAFVQTRGIAAEDFSMAMAIALG